MLQWYPYVVGENVHLLVGSVLGIHLLHLDL